MSGSLGVVFIVHVGDGATGSWLSTDLDGAPGIIPTYAACRVAGHVGVAERITPDPQREVDILFPESHSRISDRTVQLRVVVRARWDVSGDRVVVQDIACAK